MSPEEDLEINSNFWLLYLHSLPLKNDSLYTNLEGGGEEKEEGGSQ